MTVTTAGKTVKNFTVALTVEDLAVAGTYDGGFGESQASFTIAANGKISGKYLCGGTNWTISASNFATYEDGVYVAEVTRSSGKVVFADRLVVTEDEADLLHPDEEEQELDTKLAEAFPTDWKNDPWKKIGKKFPKNATLDYGDKEAEAPWSVTLKFESSGAVKVSGAFVVGKDAKDRDVVYKASGSATLIPQSEPDKETGAFSGLVFVYLAPNAKKNFGGFTDMLWVAWDGEKFDFIKE